MFKDLPEGQTHSFNDGCGESEHNITPATYTSTTGIKGGWIWDVDKNTYTLATPKTEKETITSEIIYWVRVLIDGIWWETDTRQAKRELRKYLDLLDNFNDK